MLRSQADAGKVDNSKSHLRYYLTIFSNLQIIVFLINMCYSAVDVISRKYAGEGGNQELKFKVEEICKNF